MTPTTTNQPRHIARPARVLIIAITWAAFWVLLVLAVHRGSPRTLISFHGLLHAAVTQQFTANPDATAPALTFPPENPFFAGQPLCYYWFFHFLAAQLIKVFHLNVFHAMEAIILAATAATMFIGVYLGRRLYGGTFAGVLVGFLIVAGANPFGVAFAPFQAAKYLRPIAPTESRPSAATAPTTKTVDATALDTTAAAAAPAQPQRSLRDATLQFVRHPLQALARYDSPTYLWGVVHPIYSLIRLDDFGGLYGPLLNFFLNITSRPAAIAALLALVFALESLLRSPTPFAWTSLAFLAALLTALSPIIGIAAAGTIAASLGATWFQTRRSTGAPDQTVAGFVFAPSLALLVGVLAAAPTYYHLVLGPSANKPEFQLFTTSGILHLGTLFFAAAPLTAIAWLGSRRASAAHRPLLRALLLAAVMLLTFDALVHFPAGNASNFVHAALVLLAVPGAAVVLKSDSAQHGAATTPATATRGPAVSVLRSIALFALFLPTVSVLLLAYVNRPPVPVDFSQQVPLRHPPDSELAELYDWIRRRTPADAVFVLDPRRTVAVCGNTAEFPAMTRRAMFTEHERHYLTEPYPDAQLRVTLAQKLIDSQPLDDSERRYLAHFRRPMYLLVHDARAPKSLARRLDDDNVDAPSRAYGGPLFSHGATRVFKLID